MLGQIKPEFQCLQAEGQNSNVWTDKARMKMFGKVRPEFLCLDG